MRAPTNSRRDATAVLDRNRPTLASLTSMRFSVLFATAAVATVAVSVTACGGGSSNASSGEKAANSAAAAISAALESATAVSAPTSRDKAAAGPTSTASIRILNLYAPGGQAGPAVDIYDVQLNALNGAKATPILTNIAYGTASNYVHPHLPPGVLYTKAVQLEALPTGENPNTQSGDAAGVGGLIDDGSKAEVTEILSAESDPPPGNPATSLQGALSFSQRIERGDDGNGNKGPAAPTPPDGRAELLVDDSYAQPPGDGYYLMVDSSCAPPLNGDPNATGLPEIFAAASGSPMSSFSLFATSPGTHRVSVVAWTSGQAPTCAQLTDLQATTSVTVTAGQQLELYVYGNAPTSLHVTTAPVPN